MTLAEYFECTIDFEGQRLAENLTYYILISASLMVSSLAMLLSRCNSRLLFLALDLLLLVCLLYHLGQCTVDTQCHGSKRPKRGKSRQARPQLNPHLRRTTHTGYKRKHGVAAVDC
ncbi:unnamed protein product [Absidia cylindrospora]